MKQCFSLFYIIIPFYSYFFNLSCKTNAFHGKICILRHFANAKTRFRSENKPESLKSYLSAKADIFCRAIKPLRPYLQIRDMFLFLQANGTR